MLPLKNDSRGIESPPTTSEWRGLKRSRNIANPLFICILPLLTSIATTSYLHYFRLQKYTKSSIFQRKIFKSLKINIQILSKKSSNRYAGALSAKQNKVAGEGACFFRRRGACVLNQSRSFLGKRLRKLLITCLRKAPKKGKKWRFATACFPDTIFLPNSTQVLTKFLPNFTSVEDSQNLLITFSE